MTSNLSGRVVNYFTGQPVVGAVVSIDGISTGTDVDGRFQFIAVESRVHTLKVLHRDYESHQMFVDLSRPGSYALEPVRVKPIFYPL